MNLMLYPLLSNISNDCQLWWRFRAYTLCRTCVKYCTPIMSANICIENDGGNGIVLVPCNKHRSWFHTAGYCSLPRCLRYFLMTADLNLQRKWLVHLFGILSDDLYIALFSFVIKMKFPKRRRLAHHSNQTYNTRDRHNWWWSVVMNDYEYVLISTDTKIQSLNKRQMDHGKLKYMVRITLF